MRTQRLLDAILVLVLIGASFVAPANAEDTAIERDPASNLTGPSLWI